MRLFAICGACARYVKTHERVCPFCSAAIDGHVAHVAAPPRSAHRVSRAQWLARGSALALLGCSNVAGGGGTPTHKPAPESPGAPTEDASVGAADDAEATAMTEDATTDAPLSLCADSAPSVMLGVGSFLCAKPGYAKDIYDGSVWVGTVQVDASLYCDRSKEYCYQHAALAACDPLSALRGPPTSCAAACDGGLLSCNCTSFYLGNCTDDDAGGLTIQGQCYGAPPARIDLRPSGARVA